MQDRLIWSCVETEQDGKQTPSLNNRFDDDDDYDDDDDDDELFCEYNKSIIGFCYCKIS